MGEVVEGMTIGIVSEFCVGCWESLQALQCYSWEVSYEVCMLRQDHRATRYKAVYKRLLHHAGKRSKQLD